MASTFFVARARHVSSANALGAYICINCLLFSTPAPPSGGRKKKTIGGVA